MREKKDLDIPEGAVLKPLKEGQADVTYVGSVARNKRGEEKNEILHVYWSPGGVGADGRNYAKRLRIVDRASLIKGYQVEQYIIKKVELKQEADQLRVENAKLRADLATFEGRLARLEGKGVTLVPGDPLKAGSK